MNSYHLISYDNLDEDKLYHINDKIKQFSNSNIVDSFNSFMSNTNDNSNFNQSNKKNIIIKARFYIKKDKNKQIFNTTCPICYCTLMINNSKILKCNHSLCLNCNELWNNECNKNNSPFNCPLCRK